MIKKISKIPFRGTPEQEARLRAIINESKHDKHLLMTVMLKAQDIYGYLPFEVQVMIAEGMEVPLEKVYGVSTFYAQFALSPKGKYNV
ncbi:MAG: NAD(P)H-dependent oxidoreductase subunit E, partial [Clostridia bacterium]|nr:NAD(P)H-dependent oxidoreductase subunit E [Clostridia bacterium]